MCNVYTYYWSIFDTNYGVIGANISYTYTSYCTGILFLKQLMYLCSKFQIIYLIYMYTVWVKRYSCACVIFILGI